MAWRFSTLAMYETFSDFRGAGEAFIADWSLRDDR
jgi:hypothetical protein